MSYANAARQRTRTLLGGLGVPGNQDARTVRLLRLGIGVVGTALPIALIAGNLVLGDNVIVPNSMSGSYYTSTRNLFVGALCALGGFLIGYRHTERQDRCSTFAGLCALLVAFCPTAPAFPRKEPHWVNYLHHGAAVALIFILGLFCLVAFADYAKPGEERPGSRGRRFRAWLTNALVIIKRGGWTRLYLLSGFLVFAAGLLALYIGIWPTSWSTGWPSLYLLEAVAVVAFGIAWITAALHHESAAPEHKSVTEDSHGAEPDEVPVTALPMAAQT